MKARENQARTEGREAERRVDELTALAARWSHIVEETYQWTLDMALADVRWDMVNLGALLRKVSGEFEAVAEADELWSVVLDPKSLSALTPGRSAGVSSWVKSLLSSMLPALELKKQGAASFPPRLKALRQDILSVTSVSPGKQPSTTLNKSISPPAGDGGGGGGGSSSSAGADAAVGATHADARVGAEGKSSIGWDVYVCDNEIKGKM